MGDVGLVPWVPLARFDGSPKRIVRRCRAGSTTPPITPVEQENLLAVTQFLLPLRYNKDSLLGQLRALLGGQEAMIESPLYQEIAVELTREGETNARRQDIMDVLVARFGPPAKGLEVELTAVEFDRLRELHMFAVKCRNLKSFRKQLLS